MIASHERSYRTVLSRPALRQVIVRCFTYFGLAYYSQGVIAAVQEASGDVARTVSGETNLSSTLAQSVILLGLLIAVARQPGRYAPLCRPVLPVLCIVGLALLSTLWSADPVRTGRRAVALSECVLFGMFLYRTDGLEGTVARIGQVCVAMAVLSLIAYVAVPRIGRETALGYERALRGVFPQKNSMSECMLLGLCCYAHRSAGRFRWRVGVAVSLLGLCFLLGRGASALAVAGVVGLSAAWLRWRGQPVRRLVLLFIVGWMIAASGVSLILFPQEIFALVGRDASLTGRVPLWSAILPEISRRPWFGHGYAGFWNASSATVQMIWRYAGWPAPDAHNSYLDILLQLGVVGFALYGWAWTALFRRAWAAGRSGYGPTSFVWIYGTALLLIGLDEGPMSIPNLWTTLLPLSILALSRDLALVRSEAGFVVAERVGFSLEGLHAPMIVDLQDLAGEHEG